MSESKWLNEGSDWRCECWPYGSSGEGSVGCCWYEDLMASSHRGRPVTGGMYEGLGSGRTNSWCLGPGE